MKIICIVFSLLLIQIVTTASLTSMVKNFFGIGGKKETEGVLQCISDLDISLSINSIDKFCGKEYSSNFECYSAYSSFKLCLINNECQDRLDEPEVKSY